MGWGGGRCQKELLFIFDKNLFMTFKGKGFSIRGSGKDQLREAWNILFRVI